MDHNLPMAWSQLKAALSNDDATKLKALMQKIETNPQFSNNYLLCFQELTQQIRHLHKAQIHSPFAVSEYCNLQEGLREEYNYGLCQLGSQIRLELERISPELKEDDLPPVEDPLAVQNWLNDVANAEKLSKITELQLVGLSLSILPEEIGQLTQLKGLSLSGNFLTTLPKAIEKLSMLENLELEKNCLTALPEGIEKLSKLKVLNLNGNNLVTLPDTIGKLTELRVLSSQDNRLAVLPESIGGLVNLFTLDIENNCLASLPGSIRNLTELKILRLSHNPIPLSALELVGLLPGCDMGF